MMSVLYAAAAAIFVLHLLAAPAQCTLTEQHVQVFVENGVNVTEDGDFRVFSHHGVPDHDYGPFPGEGNPNTVESQSNRFSIPISPTVAAEPGCLNMGPIGVAINGIPVYNPYSGLGYNAVEGENREIFDKCNGHPQNRGEYHYHQLPNCLYKGTEDELLGVAFDGYAIYGPLTAGNKNLSTPDLDVCHGQKRNGVYEYRITYDFPYILGCYKGVQAQQAAGGGGGMNGGPPPSDGQGMDGEGMGGEQPPPPEGEVIGGERPPPPDGEGMDGERPPPPDGEGMDGAGMDGQGGMEWSSCYATCTDPALGCDDESSENSSEEVDDGNSSSLIKSSLLPALLAIVLCFL